MNSFHNFRISFAAVLLGSGLQTVQPLDASAQPNLPEGKLSVVQVEVRGESTKGSYVNRGSGVLISRGRVLTALHLVDPSQLSGEFRWEIDNVTSEQRHRIFVRFPQQDWLTSIALLVSTNKELDIALLSVKEDDGTPLGDFCLADNASRGDSATMVGVNGATPMVFSGVIDTSIDRSSRSQSLNVPFPDDFSGAPIFSGGSLIGIATGKVMRSGSDYTLFAPVAPLQGTLLPACLSCRHASNGIERFLKSETWSINSAWRAGGNSPEAFCREIMELRRAQFPERVTTIVEKNEVSRRDSLGRVEYSYTCALRDEWEPLYREARNKACAYLSAAPGIQK